MAMHSTELHSDSAVRGRCQSPWLATLGQTPAESLQWDRVLMSNLRSACMPEDKCKNLAGSPQAVHIDEDAEWGTRGSKLFRQVRSVTSADDLADTHGFGQTAYCGEALLAVARE